MDLKAYYLTYNNLPWYYGSSVVTPSLNEARSNVHSLWELMCMREPINLTVPSLDVYNVLDEDDDWDD